MNILYIGDVMGEMGMATVEKVLPEIDKLIVDSDISQRLMSLLPLGGVVTPPVSIPSAPPATR